MRARTAPVPSLPWNARRLLAAVLCAAALLASGCQPAVSTTVVPHENPATAPSRFSPGTLFLYVSGALGRLALGQYDSAQEMLAHVDAQQAHVPEALRRVCIRYLELCQALSRTLNDLDTSLTEAERLLATNETVPARERLDACRLLIDDAEGQLTGLDGATAEAMALAGRYGTGEARAAVDEARARLDDAIRRLHALTSEYLRRLESATGQLESRSVLERPALTCSAGSDSLWVGEEVVVKGALSASGGQLGGRTVHLLVDGAVALDVVTDGTGRFVARLAAPYSYLPRLTLRARFSPAAADLALYQTVESDPVVLTVRYHETVLDVAMPAELHPGLPVTLTGRLRSLGAVAGRPVQVLLGETEVGQGATLLDGSVVCEMLTPADTAEGDSLLVLRVASVDGERTGPAEVSASLPVSRVAPSLSLGFPNLVFVPRLRLLGALLGQRGLSDDGLSVNVTLESSLPLSEPTLVARVGDDTVRSTGVEGESTVVFPLHPSVWTVGLQHARLDVAPGETWHRPVAREARFMVVNLIMVGVALIALVCVVAAMALLRRVVAVAAGGRGPVAIPAPVDVSGAVAAPQGSAAPSHRRTVVRLYLSVVRRVESLTGFVFGRSTTLREFFTAVESLLGRAGRSFGVLTGLAEEALYSSRDIGEKDAERSRELSGHVERSDPGGSGDGREGRP